MEFHLYPPNFVIEPATSFSDAWEKFCAYLLSIENKTTEIIRRVPPDDGIDLYWHSKKLAYQCKAVEGGATGEFPTQKAIASLRKALSTQRALEWEKYIICTNVDLTSRQEEKLRAIFRDVEFLTGSTWQLLCHKHISLVLGKFRLLAKPNRLFHSSGLNHDLLRRTRASHTNANNTINLLIVST